MRDRHSLCTRHPMQRCLPEQRVARLHDARRSRAALTTKRPPPRRASGPFWRGLGSPSSMLMACLCVRVCDVRSPIVDGVAMRQLILLGSILRYLWLIILSSVYATGALAQVQCMVTDPTGTSLNVRTKPNGPALGELQNGTTVTVLDHTSDGKGRPWVYVALAQNGRALGWVYREFVSCHNAKSSAASPGLAQTCKAPSLKQGASYADSRKLIIAEGFMAPTRPVYGYARHSQRVESDCEGSVDLCNGYPEIDSCSGQGHCAMVFADVYGNHLSVKTYGDVVDGSAEVTQFSIQCKN